MLSFVMFYHMLLFVLNFEVSQCADMENTHRGLWSQLVVVLALLAWGKTPNLFSPWFPHVANGDHNNTNFKGWL